MAYVISGIFTNGTDRYTFDEIFIAINQARPHTLRPDATLEEVIQAAQCFGYYYIQKYIPD